MFDTRQQLRPDLALVTAGIYHVAQVVNQNTPKHGFLLQQARFIVYLAAEPKHLKNDDLVKYATSLLTLASERDPPANLKEFENTIITRAMKKVLNPFTTVTFIYQLQALMRQYLESQSQQSVDDYSESIFEVKFSVQHFDVVFCKDSSATQPKPPIHRIEFLIGRVPIVVAKPIPE